ncbi:MAG: T9SS type B sorting domain-containing protein [Flavobacteriaceae bacterium]
MNLSIKPLLFTLLFLNTSIFFGQINDPPTVTAVGDQIYCPQSQQRIVTSFNIVDPDDTLIPAFYIQISSGYVIGEDQLSLIGSHPNVVANWNANQAKLILTGTGGGSATYTDIIAAVYDVVFNSSNINVGAKTFSLTAGSANYLASTDHYYDYVPANLITWTDAKVAAEAMDYFGLQGYLATLTIPDEGQISGELSPGTGWIGASDAGAEGVWKWMTGPEAGTTFWNGNENGSVAPGMYENWNTGEPNNYNGGEDYAHITYNTGIPGSWNDLPNNTNSQPTDYQAKGFVIEYGGTPGDPVLNISGSTTFNPPQILSTTSSVSCDNDPANLSATSNTTDILWYDSQNGGTLLHTGSTYNPILTTNTTFWILPSSNGCTTGTRTAVTATVNASPTIDTPADVTSCDGSYTLPTLTNGTYFTASNGGGTQLNPGDVISTSTTLFVYAETATTPSCSNEHSFDIGINTLPTIDTPADVTSCDSYTLPALTNGTYFTASNGGGTQLNPGDTISVSTTLFVYAETVTTPICSNEHSFDITINSTPAIDTPADVSSCDSYTLPTLTNGTYFTASNGGGTQLNPGDTISTSTTLFVYAETATTPNCSDEHSFDITINTTPTVDTPADVTSCDSYTLPALTNGTYFTASNGGGTQLNPGDSISVSSTLFVYAETVTTPNCTNEYSFNVTIDITSNATFVQIPPICEGDPLTTLPTSSLEGFTGTWSPVFDNTTSGTYTFTPDSDQCAIGTTMDITVYPVFTPTFTQVDPICVGDPLSNLNTVSDNGFSGTWSPAINNTVTTEYTFTPTPIPGVCFEETKMTIAVLTQTTPMFTQVDPICIGSVLASLPITSNDNITGSWTPALNNLATTTYTFTPDPNQCADETTMTIVVNPISVLTIDAINLSEDFDANQMILVSATGGSGIYEYQLDGGDWQSNALFEYVTGCQEHIVAVRDALGCSTIPETSIMIMEFPKLFTPNGDGYNDTWNIKCLIDDPTAVVSIFDRYGKLIFQFKPSRTAWNGTFNGSMLAATDYWFVVKYTNDNGVEAQYRSHFSLRH